MDRAYVYNPGTLRPGWRLVVDPYTGDHAYVGSCGGRLSYTDSGFGNPHPVDSIKTALVWIVEGVPSEIRGY